MKVIFRTSAHFDIAGIYSYIAQQSSQAIAQRVVTRIRKATTRLAEFPYSGRRGADKGTRELVVPRLPYIIVYEVTSPGVEIVAVFHAAQRRDRGPAD